MNNKTQDVLCKNPINFNSNKSQNYTNYFNFSNMNSILIKKEKSYNEDLIGLKYEPQTISKTNPNLKINNNLNLNHKIIPKTSSYYNSIIFSLNKDLQISKNKYNFNKLENISSKNDNQISSTNNTNRNKFSYLENNKQFLLSKNQEIENQINLLRNHAKKIIKFENSTNNSTITKNNKQYFSDILNFSGSNNFFRTVKTNIAKNSKSKNKNKNNKSRISKKSFNDNSYDSFCRNKKTMNKNYSISFKQKTINNSINKTNSYFPKKTIKTISFNKRNKSSKNKNRFNDDGLWSHNYIEDKINEIKNFIEDNKNGIDQNLIILLVLRISELENCIMEGIDKIKIKYKKKIEIKNRKIDKLEKEILEMRKIIKKKYNN